MPERIFRTTSHDRQLLQLLDHRIQPIQQQALYIEKGPPIDTHLEEELGNKISTENHNRTGISKDNIYNSKYQFEQGCPDDEPPPYSPRGATYCHGSSLDGTRPSWSWKPLILETLGGKRIQHNVKTRVESWRYTLALRLDRMLRKLYQPLYLEPEAWLEFMRQRERRGVLQWDVLCLDFHAFHLPQLPEHWVKAGKDKECQYPDLQRRTRRCKQVFNHVPFYFSFSTVAGITRAARHRWAIYTTSMLTPRFQYDLEDPKHPWIKSFLSAKIIDGNLILRTENWLFLREAG